MTNSESVRRWSELPAEEQLKLREAYGHCLDQLPPTCSMDSKIERFRVWLEERNVLFDIAD